MSDTPAYLWVLTFAGMIGIVGTTCYVLYRGAQLAGLGSRRAAGLGVAAAVLLGAWFTVSGVIAVNGGYLAGPGRLPWLPIAVVATLVVLLAATRIPLVARALSAPGTLGRLELPHTFRVAGLAFVLTMLAGHLPALFALPAGLGDFAVGVAAPFVARSTSHRALRWFNAAGIADLVVALTLGGLTGFGVIDVTPSAQALGELPLTLIPTAAVPLLLALHITSLRLTTVAERAGRVPSRAPQAAPGLGA